MSVRAAISCSIARESIGVKTLDLHRQDGGAHPVGREKAGFGDDGKSLIVRTRSDRAFVQVVFEAYVRGVFTRRVEGLVEALGVASLSNSQVSELARDLDEIVTDFRNRPLDAGPYTYVWADVLTMEVREGGHIVNVACLVATGVNGGGHREILGVDIATIEDGAGWLAYFRSRSPEASPGHSWSSQTTTPAWSRPLQPPWQG